jgi:excisionase family DNA binding protein
VADNRVDLVQDGTVPIPEALRFSGLGRSTLYGLMETGELAYSKVGKRRLIPRRALVEMLSRGLVVRES